ncbi:MAG TPA: phosphotransferase family protein, partial [Candidatus Binataceae bacterium]|nr:phosphotransferase family protein [Candidatus Binataceae bacterium]
MPASIEEITAQATAMVRAKTGDPGARVTTVEALPGHAGFGYSFILERTTSGGPSGKLVLRVAPEGVRIAGPADVVRQARIMKSLADTDVPVPPILWYGDEAEFFGRPYFVDGFVEGFKLADVALPGEEMRAYARAGVATLAALHRVPWEPRKDAWGSITELSEEMKRLDHLLDRDTLDPKVVARAPELREKLRASLPKSPRIGIVHGDFQFSNILFKDGKTSALIDWEISMIGPTLLDLGWICFFADRASFVENGTVNTATPLTPDEIVETYTQRAGVPISMDEVRWFRAFAGYRFGVITCFNVMLHRRGKRHDPHWEDIALSA